MVLQEQIVFVLTLNVQDLLEALIHEHVLTPLARPIANLLEVLLALLQAPPHEPHGSGGEDLEGAMQTEATVVQVHAAVAVRLVALDEGPEPQWEKHRVRIRFHGPIMEGITPIGDNLRPHSQKDLGVQCRPKLATELTLQAVLDHGRVETRGDLYPLVAVDAILVTAEDAGTLAVLEAQKCGLVASL